MSYKKQSNLSSRTKRRRVEDELRNIASFISDLMINHNVMPQSNSSKINFVPEVNSNSNVFVSTSNISDENVNFTPPQRSSNESILQDYLNNEALDNLSEISFNSNSESESSSDEHNNDCTSNNYKYGKTSIFVSLLAEWAVSCKITQSALKSLLVVLRQHTCFEYLPKDSRTILQTQALDTSNFHIVEPGNYYHFGLANAIQQHFPSSLQNDTSVIKIVAGVDGLPLFKSTAEEFWPILAYIRPNSNNVFPIGIYCGNRKPYDSNAFLKYFVDDINELHNSGIKINGKQFKVVIDVLCCDAPAKSFLLQTKGHTGFSSCSRCEHEGKYLLNRITFPHTSGNQPSKRTHQNYISRSDEEYHIGNTSILVTVPYFDVVSDFSMDYQHLVCLGVVRKIIYLWMKGPLTVRYPSWKIDEISKTLVGLRKNIPCEINRKPRSLALIKNWKATEFRTFLLYLGSSATKSIISKEHWKNFFDLSLGMIILLSPDYGHYINIAKKLLDNFIKQFEILYGCHLISHNVHGLSHICDDYIKFGALDNCSTFPFENYMSTLKNLIRKPDKPLIQVVKRCNEINLLKPHFQNETPAAFHFSGSHKKGPLTENIQGSQFTTLKMKKFTIKTNIEADCFLLTNNKILVKVFNIVKEKNDTVYLICKKFQNNNILFDKPIVSSELDIYTVNTLSNEFYCYSINEIKNKMIVFLSGDQFIALPLLHTSCK